MGWTKASKDFKRQKALNAQVFEQNKELAQQENDFNVQQWYRENDYNTPKAQAERLAAAGLNPDLVVQGLGGISASSPHLTAGTPMESFDVSKFTANQTDRMTTGISAINGIRDTLIASKQASLLDAQVENINADTERKSYDLGFEKEVKHLRQGIVGNEFQLGGVTIEKGKSEIKINNSQLPILEQSLKKMTAETEAIYQGIKESMARFEGLSLDNKMKAIELAFKAPTMKKQLEYLGSQIRLANANAAREEISNMTLGQRYALQMLGMSSDASLKEAQHGYYDQQTKTVKFRLGQDMTFDSLERSIQIGVECSNIMKNVATTVEQYSKSLDNVSDAVNPLQ